MSQPPSRPSEENFEEESSSFPSGESFSNYVRKIQRYPLLTSEEENHFASLWIQNSDHKAAHKLVTSHLRLVVKLAFSYKGYGLPIADLIAEGNIGLLQALKKYDPSKGFRFSTYALWWIKAAMQEYILRSWSMVRITNTVAQKKLFFNLNRIKGKLEKMGGSSKSLSDINIQKIAQDLDVPEEDVRYMEERLQMSDASLNAPLSKTEEGAEWQDFLESKEQSQEDFLLEEQTQKRKADLLKECFNLMTPREVEVLKLRRLKDPPVTLEEISKSLGVSRERIRQIEEKAFRKLSLLMQETMKKHGWNFDEL